jgi:hypothetical protein
MKSSTKKEHREIQTRNLIEWTNAEVKTARILADSGNLSYLAELVDELLADDRVKGVLPQRVSGLLGLPISFEPSGDGRKKGRAVRALEGQEDWWTIASESEIQQIQSSALLAGVALAELVWSTDETTGRVLPRLKPWSIKHLRFDWQLRAWFLHTDDEFELEIKPGDGKWLLYTPYGTNRPWSHGLWRALAKWFLSKQFSISDWARHSEIHGNPIKVGTGAEGAQAEDRDAFAVELSELGSDTSIVPPFGWDLKLVEATAKTWEMFPANIAAANEAISIVLVGQNLTSNVQSGSLAAAQVHDSVREDLIRFDALALSTAIHDQVLTWWAEFNFGSRDLAPWPVWDTKKPEPSQPKHNNADPNTSGA